MWGKKQLHHSPETPTHKIMDSQVRSAPIVHALHRQVYNNQYVRTFLFAFPSLHTIPARLNKDEDHDGGEEILATLEQR
jgi:hypothetical protein